MKLLQKICQKILISTVLFYRKFISPYKGFKCAHAHHTHGLSCSTYGLKALQENKPFVALSLIKERLNACSVIYHLYQPNPVSKPKFHFYKKQAGFIDSCDVPCDGADCHAFDCNGIDLSPDLGACDAPCENGCEFGNCMSNNVDICIWTSCDPVPCGNSSSTNTIHNKLSTEDQSNTYIVNGFVLLEEFSDFLIYQHVDSKEYYKTPKQLFTVEQILSLQMGIEKLSEDEVKQLFETK